MKFVLLFISMMLPLSVLANPVPDFPFVIVTETAQEKVKPDLASIRFTLIAYEKDSEKAMASLTSSSIKMLELLKEHDISVSQLESTQIDKRTKRARKEGVYDLEILGYEVEQGFTLKLNVLEKYPAIMNALVKTDGIQGIDALFETSQEEQYKDKLIAELSEKTRNKAETLAHAQSREVKSVYGITTEGNFGQAYAIFSLEYSPTMSAMVASPDYYGMDLIMAAPEYINIQQRITAIYELK
ncbi:SIMPL domain-containing protein [Microbulbifer spongiae]|uniref:SIMPL domain-containing protein n=1 Tax=Microbulbifer spongiae TaxID=2944933 RepID=A0ABY9E774_9GAMM|nr:SIMPL domain-containing protein [Microbulbifer sp. MI-G]WKD48522.1 SIMPL domain-containing protein [Microbulbifer sp. MI-G]